MNSLTEPERESTPTPATSPRPSPVKPVPPDTVPPDAATAKAASDDTAPLEATSINAASAGVASAGARSAASGHAMVAARAAGSRATTFARGTARLIVSHKLETVAVLLLGVGGAVYPPVWLLGALTALPSKKWDLADKWVGLVAPVLLVIVSTVLIVVFGGRHPTIGSYAFEAWLAAERVARIAAVLGAGYLLWRLRRGPRAAKQPPFGVSQRLG